jgi:hypothetical protein
LNQAAPRTRFERARAFLGTHRRAVRVSAVVVTAVVALGLVWFQPHKLFIDERLDEALPGAAEPADSTERGAEADGQPDRGVDASSSGGSIARDGSAGPRTLRRGRFLSLEHETSGQASIVQLEDGRRFLRFENLTTSNGPDLRVYLSEVPASDDWYAYGERFVDLGPLKGNLGNQNYLIPSGTGLARYESAVIWCRRFTVGFGVAPLNT